MKIDLSKPIPPEVKPLVVTYLARVARNTPQSRASKNCGTDEEREAMSRDELRECLWSAQLSIDCLDDQVAALSAPIDMVLYCPKCGTQHIDAPANGKKMKYDPFGRWDNPPHKSHLCHLCGHIWRPSDHPTNGVERTASGKDSDTQPQITIPESIYDKAARLLNDSDTQPQITIPESIYDKAARLLNDLWVGVRP